MTTKPKQNKDKKKDWYVNIKTKCGHKYGIEFQVWEHLITCDCEHCCWKICGACGKQTEYEKI